MKKKIRLTALIIAVIFSASLLTFALASSPETNPALLVSSKISDELLDEFQLTKRDSATAIVWLSDIDLSSAEAAGQRAQRQMAEKQESSDAALVATEQREEIEDVVSASMRAGTIQSITDLRGDDGSHINEKTPAAYAAGVFISIGKEPIT